MARKPKPPKDYISLSDAVIRAAQKAFSESDAPEQSARDWLFEEFCCGWQVPIVGFRKVRKGHWQDQDRKNQAIQSIETGEFYPFSDKPDFSDPPAWQALDGEPLILDESEYGLRLSSLQRGAMPVLECPVFSDAESTRALAWAREIEARYTKAAPLSEIQKVLSEVTEETRLLAFSDPRIADENRFARYSHAPEHEAERWIVENPPLLPETRPRPAGMLDAKEISLTLCEAIVWVAEGNPLNWWDWVYAQIDLKPREKVIRDELFSIAEGEVRRAIANEQLTGFYMDESGVRELDWKIFTPPSDGDQPSIDGIENRVGLKGREFRNVYFLVADLMKCWPNLVSASQTHEAVDEDTDEQDTNTLERPKRTKLEIEKLYVERCEEFREVQGRRPTKAADHDWARSVGVSRPRIRELRKKFGTAYEKVGGAPKRMSSKRAK